MKEHNGGRGSAIVLINCRGSTRLYLGGTMTKAKKRRPQVTLDMIVNLFVLTVCLTVISAVLVAVWIK